MKKQFIKIFAETTMSALESKINNYLENNPVKIISISYNYINNAVFKERAFIYFEEEQNNE